MRHFLFLALLTLKLTINGAEPNLNISYSLTASNEISNCYDVLVKVEGPASTYHFALICAEKSNGGLFEKSTLHGTEYTFKNVHKGNYIVTIGDDNNQGFKQIVIE